MRGIKDTLKRGLKCQTSFGSKIDDKHGFDEHEVKVVIDAVVGRSLYFLRDRFRARINKLFFLLLLFFLLFLLIFLMKLFLQLPRKVLVRFILYLLLLLLN